MARNLVRFDPQVEMSKQLTVETHLPKFEHLNAEFENGILKVTGPFQASAAPKAITIESGRSPRS